MSDKELEAAIRARDAACGFPVANQTYGPWLNQLLEDRRTLLRMLDRSDRMIAELWGVLANDEELFSMACAAVDEVRDA